MVSESNPEPAGAIQPGSDNCYRPTRPVPRRNLYVDADYGGTSKWIAPLCVCSDCNTCCLAHFCSCFLCGKTDWRFERMHKGEDPLNSSWKCSYGFNPVCTACCIVTLITLLPGPLVIAYQRYRVRQLYDIQGNAVCDLMAAYCCPPCTNARIDREIRVREGDKRLRRKWENKANYRAAVEVGAIQHINAPPRRIEPMRYVSPRVTSEHTSNHSFVPPLNAQGCRALHDVQSVEPQKPRLAFLRPQKHRNNSNPQQGNEAEFHPDEVEELLCGIGGSNLEGQNSSLGNRELGQPIETASPPASIIATEAQKATPPSEAHNSVARRAELETENTDAQDGTSIEHTSTNFEGGDIATSLRGKRSTIGVTGGHELSYVHDFSDCPVSKSVLMYYEKEENKSKKPPSQDRTRSSLLSNNPYQCLLGDQQVDSLSSGRHRVSNRHTEFSGEEVSSSGCTAGPRTTTYRMESEDRLECSSNKAATRSTDDFVPTFLPSDIEARTDKKATSF